MQMDEGLDTGSVLSKVVLPIAGDEIGNTLHDKLAAAGAGLLADSLGPLLAGELNAQAQPETGVTYAHKLQKVEALLDWQQDALALERQVRAFNAWPVAQTQMEGKTLRVWRAKAVAEAADAAPGTVIGESAKGILVACGVGQLALQEIQLPGKRPLPVRDFLNANSMLGMRLG
jgi:methionyl-tRNA formyltransferase